MQPDAITRDTSCINFNSTTPGKTMDRRTFLKTTAGACRLDGWPSGTEAGVYTDLDKKEDVKILHGMGYAQELDRRMGRFSNFAISFSIICIMSGGINSLAQAMSGAGGGGRRTWMAARLHHLRRFRPGAGPDQLGLSDGRWALPLGLDPRQSFRWMADRLAQSPRLDHWPRRDQCRYLDLFRRRVSVLWDR